MVLVAQQKVQEQITHTAGKRPRPADIETAERHTKACKTPRTEPVVNDNRYGDESDGDDDPVSDSEGPPTPNRHVPLVITESSQLAQLNLELKTAVYRTVVPEFKIHRDTADFVHSLLRNPTKYLSHTQNGKPQREEYRKLLKQIQTLLRVMAAPVTNK